MGAVGDDAGGELMPERHIGYDALVLVVGSTANYFGVPGAREHTISLNASEDAELFRLKLLKPLSLVDQRKPARGQAGVDFVIIGIVCPAQLCVWAAGIKAPDFLSGLGLPSNRAGQIEVAAFPDIHALGDCAACLGADGKPATGRPFVYRDYGSLVSFGQSASVGTLMGTLKGMSWFVAGMMYVSLLLLHHQAVLGTVRTGVLAVARLLIQRGTPQVKLH